MKFRQILFAVLLLLPSVSFATDFYVATTDLNIRSGPGKRYPVSFTLNEGDEVEILSNNGDWYEIRYMGKTGYAYSTLLSYSRTVSATEALEKPQIVFNFLIGAFICLVLYVSFIIYSSVRRKKLLTSVTESNRGTRTERDLVLRLLKFGIPAQYIFHDLYVEKSKGAFSQIDLVVVTSAGIIAFEVKDYSGWIFGSGNQRRWTQVLAYGKRKYQFYNPIMQNNRHVAELRRLLISFDNIPFYSIAVFYGNSVFKQIDFVPIHTFVTKSGRVLEVVNNIIKDNASVHYSNEVEILRVLRLAMDNGRIVENRTRHSENIADMLGTDRVFD